MIPEKDILERYRINGGCPDDIKMVVKKYGLLLESVEELTKKEMIAQFREFTPEIISRFGFDDQMDNAMDFVKTKFANQKSSEVKDGKI